MSKEIKSKLEDMNLSIRLARLNNDPKLSDLVKDKNLQECLQELPQNKIIINDQMSSDLKDSLFFIYKLYIQLKSNTSSSIGKYAEQFYNYFNDYVSKHTFNCGPNNIDMMTLMLISKSLDVLVVATALVLVPLTNDIGRYFEDTTNDIGL